MAQNILSPFVCFVFSFPNAHFGFQNRLFSPVLAIGFFLRMEAMDLLKSGWEYLDVRRLEEAGGQMCGPDLGVFLRRCRDFDQVRRDSSDVLVESAKMALQRENWSKWFKWLGGFTEPLG